MRFTATFWTMIVFALVHTTFANAAQKTVGILLFPGVEIIDFSGPYEIFGWAGYRVVTISEDGKALRTTMDLQVTPTYSFASAPTLDVLVIPGGDIQNAMHHKPTLEWIKSSASTSGQILSVCNGAFILAETGLLNGLSATTFYPAQTEFKNSYPQIKTLSNRRLVDNGKIVTAGGLSSGIDAALYMVGKLEGVDAARSIAMSVEYPWQPEQGFVRGNMADSQLQHLYAQLPKDLQVDEFFAYGSEREWHSAYNLPPESPHSLDDLKQLVGDAVKAAGEWQPVNKTLGRWQKKTGEMLWILEAEYQQQQDHLRVSFSLHR